MNITLITTILEGALTELIKSKYNKEMSTDFEFKIPNTLDIPKRIVTNVINNEYSFITYNSKDITRLSKVVAFIFILELKHISEYLDKYLPGKKALAVNVLTFYKHIKDYQQEHQLPEYVLITHNDPRKAFGGLFKDMIPIYLKNTKDLSTKIWYNTAVRIVKEAYSQSIDNKYKEELLYLTKKVIDLECLNASGRLNPPHDVDKDASPIYVLETMVELNRILIPLLAYGGGSLSKRITQPETNLDYTVKEYVKYREEEDEKV